MAQRFSGRARRVANHYPSPHWVTRAILPHLGPGPLRIWEPACGEGKMVEVLRERHQVIASDIRPDAGCGRVWDFLTPGEAPPWARRASVILTNPPFGLAGREAVKFIVRALELMAPRRGMVVMLLKADFDSGKTRVHLFRDNPAFAKRIVFLDRIMWFDHGDGQSPSENHAAFLWDFTHQGPPVVAYATKAEAEMQAPKLASEAA